MGIASGVFWICFGICFLIYKAFKESPEVAIPATVGSVTACVTIAVLTLIARFLMDDFPWYVPTIFAIVATVLCLYPAIRKDKKEEERARIMIEVADREITDELLEQIGREACRKEPEQFSTDISSPNYWRRDGKMQAAISLWQESECDRIIAQK